MPFQMRRKMHIPLASYGKRLRRRAWLTIWDRVKIPRYSHKQMHRKRVTCQLHDSYFRSRMIKTCHSKDGGSCIFRWEIEWAPNYYITRVKTGSQSVGDQMSWRQDAVEKASTQQSVPPGPRLSSSGERERNPVMANRVGVNMLQFCSVSNSLSHTTLSNKVRGIFF